MDLTVRTPVAADVFVVFATITQVTAMHAYQIVPGARLVRRTVAPTAPSSAVRHLMAAVHMAVLRAPMALCVNISVLSSAHRHVYSPMAIVKAVRIDSMGQCVIHPALTIVRHVTKALVSVKYVSLVTMGYFVMRTVLATVAARGVIK